MKIIEIDIEKLPINFSPKEMQELNQWALDEFDVQFQIDYSIKMEKIKGIAFDESEARFRRRKARSEAKFLAHFERKYRKIQKDIENNEYQKFKKNGNL